MTPEEGLWHASPMTTTLMISAGQAPAEARDTRTGGVPLAPEGFAWPLCGECEKPMLFLAHVRLDGLKAAGGHDVLALFQCENDEGCETWEAGEGANLAAVFREEGLMVVPPPQGNTVRPEVEAVKLVGVGDTDYDEARLTWSREEGRTPRWVLGQIGGRPAWLQGDDTPECPRCAFVVQLEEGHDHRTAANFGGGSAYAFVCGPCGEAAFLWQQ